MQEPLLDGMAQTELDRREAVLRPGNTNCGGCGMSIAWHTLSRAIAHRPVQLTIPACCGIVAAGPFPTSAYAAPIVATTFASAAAVATGLAQAARLNGDDTRVICWAGDGGTYDIGMATVSAAAERNEDILYVCYDNEIYGNTGGQRSSATPVGASTTTTPFGKKMRKKDMVGIMAAHAVPYTATISMAHPDDAMRKLRFALDLHGFRFIHILSPCPTGWKSEPAEGIELVRLAVQSGLYAVYEIFDGDRVVINLEPEMSEDALERYFAAQGRFRKAKVDLEQVQAEIHRSWELLRAREAVSPT
jgi:pyruvate ferredoxin oxidoreductase beta subunit/2-oxoisovalerate ferredoxin oxidoreductase beta subunit